MYSSRAMPKQEFPQEANPKKPLLSSELFDVVVIGAGIVGAMIIRELSRFQLKIAIVDKEFQPGLGISRASNSFIHRNHVNPTGTLKANLCKGSQTSFRKLSRELNAGYREADEINIAFDAEQEIQVKQRLDWAIRNGEKNFKVISRAEACSLEPRLTKEFIYAIHSTDSGIIHPPEFAFALVENAIQNKAQAFFSNPVVALVHNEDLTWTIETDQGILNTRFLINAAGLYADRIAHLAGDKEVKQYTLRATLSIFDSTASSMLSHLLYVAGVDTTFSQLMGPTLHGNILLGLGHFQKPNDPDDTRVTREGLAEILQMGRKIIPDLPEKDLITSFAGMTLSNNLAKKGDFYLGPSSISNTLLYALITPPGITAAPGISKYMIDLLSNAGLDLVEKPDFNPYREKPFRFKDASEKERRFPPKKLPARAKDQRKCCAGM